MDKKEKRSAQAFIEFMVVLPLLLMIVFFIIDIGRVVFYYSAFSNAAREGARFGVVNPTVTAIYNETERFISSINLGGDNTPTILPPIINGTVPDGTVKVIIEYTIEPITPLMNLFFPDGGIDFSTESVMYLEQNP